MSSILDALKKSEQTRQLGRELIFQHDSPSEPHVHGPLRWTLLAVILLVLLFVGLAVLAWIGTAVDPRSSRPDSVRDGAPVSDNTGFPQPGSAVTTPAGPVRLSSHAAEPDWLSSLPDSFRRTLPPLKVNIHVYSPEVSRRILYINNHPVQPGEQVEGGAVVEAIVMDGVILSYRGQRFKLPRPR